MLTCRLLSSASQFPGRTAVDCFIMHLMPNIPDSKQNNFTSQFLFPGNSLFCFTLSALLPETKLFCLKQKTSALSLILCPSPTTSLPFSFPSRLKILE